VELNRENRLLIVTLAVLAAGLLMTGGLTVHLTITRERGSDVTPAAQEATDMRDPAQVGSTDEEITTQIRSSDGMVMVYVPASEFRMESSDEEVDAALEMQNTHYGGAASERGSRSSSRCTSHRWMVSGLTRLK